MSSVTITDTEYAILKEKEEMYNEIADCYVMAQVIIAGMLERIRDKVFEDSFYVYLKEHNIRVTIRESETSGKIKPEDVIFSRY